MAVGEGFTISFAFHEGRCPRLSFRFCAIHVTNKCFKKTVGYVAITIQYNYMHYLLSCIFC